MSFIWEWQIFIWERNLYEHKILNPYLPSPMTPKNIRQQTKIIIDYPIEMYTLTFL